MGKGESQNPKNHSIRDFSYNFCPIGGLHCRHVGVQNKRKFVPIVCIKIEVNSQRRKISLFLYTNMAAMMSHANHQYPTINEGTDDDDDDDDYEIVE